MKKRFTIILLFLSVTLSHAQVIRYVKQGGTGNGTSWAAASGDLQAMINTSGVNQVWVAAGTYKPTTGTDRGISFSMKSGVAIYGGFPSSGNPAMADRNWNTNQTILSGDIGVVGVNTDNSSHVIYGGNTISSSTVLSGFVITSAYNEAFDFGIGGGVYLMGENGTCSPIFENCTFRNNTAGAGGAVAVLGNRSSSSVSPTFSNCLFYNNIANTNSIGSQGGALYGLANVTLDVKNCTFANNQATGNGGAIAVVANSGIPTLNLNSSVLWNNSAGRGSNEILSGSSTINLSNSILKGGTAGIGTAGFANIGTINNNGGVLDADPLFANTANGDYSLQACSPAINTGSNTGISGVDLANNPRIYNNGVVDIGAYEFQAVSVTAPTNVSISTTIACEGTSVNLTATCQSGSTVTWYNAATGGSSIGSGSPFAYPAPVGNNQTFYASCVGSCETARVATSSTLTVTSSPTRLYVKASATGANTGLSWADAFTDLQSALKYACKTNLTEIWVAAGTYKPHATDRSISFSMLPNVKIYGGFPNTGNPTMAERNWKTNPTILSGDLNGDDVVSGSGATLSIANNGENSLHVIYNFYNPNNPVNPQSVLDGFTVTGGNANIYNSNNGGIDINGGGMYNDFSSPTIRNVVFVANKAKSDGGGVMNKTVSKPSFENVKFLNNYSETISGALAAESDINLSNVVFEGNYATYHGGGMYILAINVNMTNVSFLNNASGKGGGLAVNAASVVNLTNAIFASNKASEEGGGIYCTATVNLKNSTFYNNVASNGGAIFQQGGSLTINNGINWENKINTSSTSVGADIRSISGSRAINYTMLQLLNTDYSGITLGAGNIFAQNPLLVNSIDPDGADNIFGTADDGLILTACSPAVNVGDNSANTSTTDLAGNPRIFNTTIDMGAYELQSAALTPPARLYVNASTTGSNTGLSWADAFTDLQSALNYSCKTNLTEIWVAAGTYKPHATDRNISFSMIPNVKIYGGFPNTGDPTMAERNWNTNKTILSGDLSGNDVVTGSGATLSITGNGENSYHVIFNDNNGLTTSNSLLDGFTITGGNANNGGGGMYNSTSSPSLKKIIFSGNNTNTTGGGMYNSTSSPSLNDVTFFCNNAGGSGGGMTNQVSSSPSLNNVFFTGNKAGNVGGGTSSSSSSLSLTNVTFSGNSSYNGAGMYNSSSSLSLTNMTFSGNNASNANGGGMLNSSSSIIIKNSIFWGNKKGGNENITGADIENINSSTASISNTALQLVSGSYGNTFPNISTSNNLFAQNPLFLNAIDPDGADNIFGTADDGLVLSACSPVVNVGDNVANTSITDLAGNPRIFNTTIDMGAYETQSLPPTRLYVNASATGANTGLSWSDAFTDLQSALNYSCKTNLTEIWVAKGTYKPTSTSNQNISFSLVNGVSLYGGFDGTETQRSQRNWATNVTTLSGLIGQGVFFNSIHVVYSGSGITNSTELDGFTIANGTALFTIGSQSFNTRYGGGMFIDGPSSPAIKNCIFQRNYAGNGASGSAIAIVGGTQSSSPIIQNCLFYQNSNELSTNTLYCQGNAQPSIINCTFYKEQEESYSISCSDVSNISVKNSIFYGEAGLVSLSPISLSNSTLTISNSLIKGGVSGISKSNSTVNTNGNIFSDTPLFTNADIGDFTLQACSPAINTGDNTANTNTTDLAGNTRIFNTTIDMGAYEFQSAAVTAPTGVSISATTACEGTSVNLTATCQSGSTVTWYNAATGGTSIGSGSPFSYSAPVGSNQTFYASCVNSCETARMATSNTLTVNAKPTKPTITVPTEKVVCSPAKLTLSVSNCAGTVTWFGSGATATGTSLELSTVGTYSISATCTVDGCSSDVSDAVMGLEIKSKPSVPNITPPSQLAVCSPSTLELTATCQTGNVVWSTGATGTNLTLNTVGTYSISAKCTLNGGMPPSCDSDQSSVTNLEIKAKPSVPNITPPSQLVVCSPSTLELTATCQTGNVVWSTGATSTSLTLNTVGTYSISAKCTLNGGMPPSCDSDQSSVTNLEIKSKPNVPTITPPSQLVVCSPSTLELTATCQTGNVVWSTGATGTNLTLNTVGTYSISAKCTLNGGMPPSCDSDQSSATNLEIKSKPNVPSITPPSQLVVCSPSTLELTATCQTGNVVWSTGATGTSLTLNTVGTYSISAKCTLNGGMPPSCDSDQSSVTNLEIKSKPNVPTITPPSQLVVCSPSTLQLTATCQTGTVVWSTGATGTSLTLNAVGTYAISAKCTLNGGMPPSCDSDQSSVTNLEIKAKPSMPTITPPSQLVVCSPSTLELMATCQTGNVVWSTGATGTSLTLNTVGTYSISAKCTLNGGMPPSCDSDQSSATNLEIKAKPSVPNITPPSQLVVCSPSTLELTATCQTGTVVWSTGATGTNLTLNTVGTYSISAKCTLNGGMPPSCDSEQSSVTNLEIKSKPNVPTITPPSQLVVCSPSTLELMATCQTGTVVWSTGATGTNLALNTVGTYSISAKCTLNGGMPPSCDSDQSSATNLEIKAKPNVPTVTPPSQLAVCSPSTLELTATCTTGNVVWSTGATGTSLTLNAVGTYAISAKCTLNGCDSDQSSATNLEIKALPNVSATNTGPYTVGQSISLVGNGGGTYSWNGPNNFSSTFGTLTITNALSVNGGIYTLTVVGVNSCSAVATTNVVVSGVDPCDPSRIVDYLYVKAGNPHQPMFNLTDGMIINQITEQVSILVTPSLCPSVTIESFEMNIQGPELNWNVLQNVAPNALFDNFGSDIWGRNFKPGSYTLTITGYAQDNKGGGITYGPKIIRFTVVGNLATINAPILSKSTICAGSMVDVSFNTSGIFNIGNEFRVELSDSSGSFATPILIGTTNGIGTLSCTIPQNTLEGTKYLIRVSSSNQVVVSNPAMSQVTIHPYSYNLVSPTNNLTGTKTKKAVMSISASNKVTSPTSVTYQAGKSILLTPGFESGAVFKAEIRGCEN